MTGQTIEVRAFWDDEAAVFVATSDDVPGLVAEGPSIEALRAKLAVLVPELLELNDAPGFQPGTQLRMRLVVEWIDALPLPA